MWFSSTKWINQLTVQSVLTPQFKQMKNLDKAVFILYFLLLLQSIISALGLHNTLILEI